MFALSSPDEHLTSTTTWGAPPPPQPALPHRAVVRVAATTLQPSTRHTLAPATTVANSPPSAPTTMDALQLPPVLPPPTLTTTVAVTSLTTIARTRAGLVTHNNTYQKRIGECKVLYWHCILLSIITPTNTSTMHVFSCLEQDGLATLLGGKELDVP